MGCYLAFRCLGRFFVSVTMPFGLASAPLTLTWTKAPRRAVPKPAGLSRRRLRGRLWGRAARRPATKAQAKALYRCMERLMGGMGLSMHRTMSVKQGLTQVRLMGHLVTRLAPSIHPAESHKCPQVRQAAAPSASKSLFWEPLKQHSQWPTGTVPRSSTRPCAPHNSLERVRPPPHPDSPPSVHPARVTAARW